VRQKLGIASDIAVIAVAILMAVVVAKNYLLPPPRPSALVKAGDTLSDVAVLGLRAAHKKHLLVVQKKGCPYCEGSAPLYKELAQLETSGQTAVKMVAVFEEPVDVARSVLLSENVQMEAIGGVSLGKLRIGGTPTLMLVDEGGRVLRVWEGLLSRKAEEELKAVLTSGAAAR